MEQEICFALCAVATTTMLNRRTCKDGGDNYEAKWGGRGDLAVIPMWGECGSQWEVCIGFHKGQSRIFVRVSESCKAQEQP